MDKYSSTYLHRACEWLGILLLLMMLLLPLQYQIIKLLIICLLFGATILISLQQSIFIVKTHLLWVFLFIFSGLFSITYGYARSNPAPSIYLNIYIAWPLVFFYFSTFITLNYLKKIIQICKIALFLLSVSGIAAFIYFNINADLNAQLFSFEPSFRPGFPLLAIAGGAVTSFIFLYFLIFSFTILSAKKALFDIFNLVLGFFFIICTSRRAFFINFILSFFLIFIFSFIAQKKQWYQKIFKFFIMLFCLLGGLLLLLSFLEIISFNELIQFTLEAFGGNNAYDPRILQAQSLIEGWQINPILGNASGVNASIIRSEFPGTYELSYHAMLFERGIIGFTIFIIQYIILNIWCIQSIRRSKIEAQYIIAYLVALNLFMLANASNPYLGAFDYMWYLFFAFVFLNFNMLNKNDENMCINQSL